jgi:hypothetical protein
VIEIAGTTYYTVGEPYVFYVLTAVLFPLPLLLIWLLNRWLLGRRLSGLRILGLAVVLTLGVEAALYSDVYWIGQEAKRLCREEAGLRIYKKPEVKALKISLPRDNKVIIDLLNLGYPAVEIERWLPKSSADKITMTKKTNKVCKVYRYTLSDGSLKKEEIPAHSEDAVRYRKYTTDKVLSRYFVKTTRFLKDVHTGEVLSEAIHFSIYPGRVDSFFVGVTGFSFTPWFCGDHGYGSDLAVKTLKPYSKNTQGGDK